MIHVIMLILAILGVKWLIRREVDHEFDRRWQEKKREDQDNLM